MLSRVADSIYWMGRYIERAENVARFVDVNLHLLLDLPEDFEGQWGALVKITGDYEDFEKRYSSADDESVIEFLTFDRANPNSILSCVLNARENARSIREIISAETWEALNEFYLTVTAPRAKGDAGSNPHEFFRGVRKACHLLEGVMSETMSRGEAWHFSRVGRLLERADKTTRILDIKYFLLLPDASDVGSPIDDLHWTAVLRSASAQDMYRKVHGRVTPDLIVRFLVLDREFPRSTLFCLSEAEHSLHAITGTPHKTFRNLAERRLGQLVAELDYTDEQEIVKAGLHESLDQIQAKINRVGDCVFETFFTSKPVRGSTLR
ncbi:MAG: alpha-E domain-containing protein [Acidobacteria bacterium]|nr:alpha-E domain-containing protein [Acidobacteriota bacterium]